MPKKYFEIYKDDIRELSHREIILESIEIISYFTNEQLKLTQHHMKVSYFLLLEDLRDNLDIALKALKQSLKDSNQ